MSQTTNYGFNISTGPDLVNPLTQIFPNFTDLDSILKGVENKTIGVATELKTGTVHAITRTDTDAPMFRFQATANFETNDTFTVDGLQVSALDVSGQNLASGAFVIGSMVLCELRDNLLTVYVSGSADAQTLDGHDSTYFATASGLETVDDKADANKILIDNLSLEVDGIGDVDPLAHATASGSTAMLHNISDYRKIVVTCESSGIASALELQTPILSRDTTTRWTVTLYGLSSVFNSNLALTFTYVDDTHISITFYSTGLEAYVYGIK